MRGIILLGLMVGGQMPRAAKHEVFPSEHRNQWSTSSE